MFDKIPKIEIPEIKIVDTKIESVEQFKENLRLSVAPENNNTTLIKKKVFIKTLLNALNTNEGITQYLDLFFKNDITPKIWLPTISETEVEEDKIEQNNKSGVTWKFRSLLSNTDKINFLFSIGKKTLKRLLQNIEFRNGLYGQIDAAGIGDNLQKLVVCLDDHNAIRDFFTRCLLNSAILQNKMALSTPVVLIKFAVETNFPNTLNINIHTTLLEALNDTQTTAEQLKTISWIQLAHLISCSEVKNDVTSLKTLVNKWLNAKNLETLDTESINNQKELLNSFFKLLITKNEIIFSNADVSKDAKTSNLAPFAKFTNLGLDSAVVQRLFTIFFSRAKEQITEELKNRFDITKENLLKNNVALSNPTPIVTSNEDYLKLNESLDRAQKNIEEIANNTNNSYKEKKRCLPKYKNLDDKKEELSQEINKLKENCENLEGIKGDISFIKRHLRDLHSNSELNSLLKEAFKELIEPRDLIETILKNGYAPTLNSLLNFLSQFKRAELVVSATKGKGIPTAANKNLQKFIEQWAMKYSPSITMEEVISNALNPSQPITPETLEIFFTQYLRQKNALDASLLIKQIFKAVENANNKKEKCDKIKIPESVKALIFAWNKAYNGKKKEGEQELLDVFNKIIDGHDVYKNSKFGGSIRKVFEAFKKQSEHKRTTNGNLQKQQIHNILNSQTNVPKPKTNTKTNENAQIPINTKGSLKSPSTTITDNIKDLLKSFSVTIPNNSAKLLKGFKNRYEKTITLKEIKPLLKFNTLAAKNFWVAYNRLGDKSRPKIEQKAAEYLYKTTALYFERKSFLGDIKKLFANGEQDSSNQTAQQLIDDYFTALGKQISLLDVLRIISKLDKWNNESKESAPDKGKYKGKYAAARDYFIKKAVDHFSMSDNKISKEAIEKLPSRKNAVLYEVFVMQNNADIFATDGAKTSCIDAFAQHVHKNNILVPQLIMFLNDISNNGTFETLSKEKVSPLYWKGLYSPSNDNLTRQIVGIGHVIKELSVHEFVKACQKISSDLDKQKDAKKRNKISLLTTVYNLAAKPAPTKENKKQIGGLIKNESPKTSKNPQIKGNTSGLFYHPEKDAPLIRGIKKLLKPFTTIIH